MKVRVLVSALFFVLLVLLDRLQYRGPISAEFKNTFVILVGFLLPAILNGRQPLQKKVVISVICSFAAAIVWNVWSNSSLNAWEPSFLVAILAIAIAVFGVAIVVNEIVIHLFSKKLLGK